MNTYFIIILFTGLFYLFANLLQLMSINKSQPIAKHIDKVYLLFSILVVFSEGHHIVNFLSNNFAYNTVFENSSINTPLIYKIAATYTGQGGSFLLWLLILSLIGIPFLKNKNPLVRILFIIFPLILTAAMYDNGPFVKTLEIYSSSRIGKIPTNGIGLNKILQNPYNLFHPQFLFTGFSFFYVPCILAFTLLLQWNKLINNKEKIQNIFNIIYKYNLLGIITLSIGILLGMLWANDSWGRFWGWDSIENTALIPLLISIALQNSIWIYKRKDAMLKTNIILAAIIFPFILLCTFIVRSGIIRSLSIHSYMNSNIVASLLILALILLIFIYLILLYFFRLKSILKNYKTTAIISNFSPELFISLNIIVFILLTIVVIVGTISIIFGNIYVNNDFFIKWCSPLCVIMICLYIMSVIAYKLKK